MLIYRLQNNEELSNSEQALADFVLSHLPDVCNMNTRQVAKESFVSPATVTRFSKKLGFEGFDQFKRQLYAEWKSSEGKEIQIDADFPFEKIMSYDVMFDRLLLLEQKALQATRELIVPENWDNIICGITRFRNIDIYGEGVSYDTARNFKSNMNRIGYDVFMENDRALQKNRCTYLYENHFNIILSYTGESRRPLEIARFLHQYKRDTLSITNETDNSLMRCTTYHLSVAKLEGRILSGGISNMCSSISFAFLLDLIYASVFQKNYEANLRTIHDIVTRQDLYMPR